MLKKIKNLDSEDIFLLASFANIKWDDLVNGVNVLDGDEKNIKYKQLLYDSSMNKGIKTPVQFNVSNVIDQLMFDNYGIFLKLQERVADYMWDNEQEGADQFTTYVKLYEKLLLNSKFEYANIRSIQIRMMEKRIVTESRLENYEKCIELQTKLKEV